MFIKEFYIRDFRKFGDKDNCVIFALPSRASAEDGNVCSTLLVGQNNTGKTSIISALKKFCGYESFSPTDFNYSYLENIFKKLKEKADSLTLDNVSDFLPSMSFRAVISIDTNEDDDCLANLSSFITTKEITKSYSIFARYECTEKQKIVGKLLEFVKNENEREKQLEEKIASLEKDGKEAEAQRLKSLKGLQINSFIEFIRRNQELFKLNFYRTSEAVDAISDFHPKDLFTVKSISLDEQVDSLKNRFSDYLSYFIVNNSDLSSGAGTFCEKFNDDVDQQDLAGRASSTIQRSLEKTFDEDRISFLLKSNISAQSLMQNVFDYFFDDSGEPIPEKQYGSGYQYLMAIAVEILDYFTKEAEDSASSRVCLITIEEPETHMHPQLAERFIKKIDQLVKEILPTDRQDRRVQVLITTHSSAVVRGKLDKDKSFNAINYLRYNSHEDNVVSFGDEDSFNADKYLFKYFKYQLADSFFADAVILVEGTSEEILFPKFIEEYSKEEKGSDLTKKYIGIFPVGGAFAHKYFDFFKKLGTPVAFVTDIDIAGSKESVTQISKIDEQSKTTNHSIINWNKAHKGNSENPEMLSLNQNVDSRDGHMGIFFQGKENGFFPTSFEEALILANCDSNSLKNTLSSVFGVPGDLTQSLKEHSHQIQNKIGERKEEFAFEIFKDIENDGDIRLPTYIQNCLAFLESEIKKQ
jgi:putative ATP-dependent endonuclease of OLD family